MEAGERTRPGEERSSHGSGLPDQAHPVIAVGELPPEAERLLAAAPDEFVEERRRVARELREAGRREDATLVADMRKPPAVVLAVNRAARDRPQVAQDAAGAAERVLETQFSGDAGAYREATRELEQALDLLAEVAVVRVSPGGKPASDALSRRVRDLLRAAVADEDGRRALARGVLTEEREAAGFAALAGAVPDRSTRRRRAGTERKRAETGAAAAKRKREEKLRAELERAENALRTAVRAAEQAARERAAAEKVVTALRKKLERS